MRLTLIAAALSLSVAPALAAAEKTPFAVFAEKVDGFWSRMPSEPLMAFGGGDIAVALRGCGGEAAQLVRYVYAEGKLIRTGGTAQPVAILDVRRTGNRNGFQAWAIATNAGLQAVLLGEMGPAASQVSVMIADEGSYVRCPLPKAEPTPATTPTSKT